MLIEQVPEFLRLLYPHAEWRGDTSRKVVYLTFDDGPIPGVTPWVLDLLDKYGIKATFFLVGDNVRKHPEDSEKSFELKSNFEIIDERKYGIAVLTFLRKKNG